MCKWIDRGWKRPKAKNTRVFVGAQVIEPNRSDRPSVFEWLRGPFVVRGWLGRLANRGGREQRQVDEARVSKSETKSDMVLFG